MKESVDVNCCVFKRPEKLSIFSFGLLLRIQHIKGIEKLFPFEEGIHCCIINTHLKILMPNLCENFAVYMQNRKKKKKKKTTIKLTYDLSCSIFIF